MSEEQGKYDIDMKRRENAVLRKYAAIQKASEEKIGCQKVYVDIAGGIEEAFILDELIFFTLPRPETGKSGLRVRKDGVLWMAVSRSEWWKRKRITAKQADGAIERLVKTGLIFKEMFLFNKQKTTHLRLNVPEFFKRYSEELEKQNPPENEGDTISKDINELYEMMGIPVKDTTEGIPDEDTGILKRDKVSLNGDSINSPDTPPTQPLKDAAAPLSSEDLHEIEEAADRTVDGILGMNQETARRDAEGTAWRGRELTPPQYLPYGDWWHSKTNQHMYGEKAKQKVNTEWLKAFKEWWENDLTTDTLDQVYDAEKSWKGVIGKPSELTTKAIALQAMPNALTQAIQKIMSPLEQALHDLQQEKLKHA